MRTVLGRTPATDDVRAWLEAEYPEGDASVDHTADCDRTSTGDECVGDCLVVLVEEPTR